MWEEIWFFETSKFFEKPSREFSKLAFSLLANEFKIEEWDHWVVETESTLGKSETVVILITACALTMKEAGMMKKQKTKTYIVQKVIPNQKNWDTKVKVSSWGMWGESEKRFIIL